MSLPRVLLVEDDASISRFVALALEDEPIELLHADSVQQALQRLQGDGPFRLVISDLMLPDGSGLQLLQTLATDPALRAMARLAAFSAGLSAEVRAELDRLGIDEVIGKPASMDDLLQCLNRALDAPAPAPGVQPDPSAEAVARYFAGDQALYDAYRASCVLQFAHDRRAGDAAVASGDAAGLRRLAHSLKTVLQTLGHDADGAVARQLETDAAEAARAGAERGAGAVALTGALTDGWARLGQALDRLASD